MWGGHSCPPLLTLILNLFSCNPYLQVPLQIKSAALKPRFQISCHSETGWKPRESLL